jgi:uncharacterized protein YprB with RNaseH-like and TPR domain
VRREAQEPRHPRRRRQNARRTARKHRALADKTWAEGARARDGMHEQIWRSSTIAIGKTKFRMRTAESMYQSISFQFQLRDKVSYEAHWNSGTLEP